MNVISNYLEKINTRYQTGISREHSYRGDLQNLLEILVPDILVTNEPARIDCGAPDYILTRKNIPVGYIEAKDIGVDLNSKIYNEQFDRYRKSLDNLTITDYLTFQFYKEGDFITSIAIGEPRQNKIQPLPEYFDQFNNLITDFATTQGQTITSAKKLAQMMAGKAKLMAKIIENSLNNDEVNAVNTDLKEQMQAFKKILLHDITAKDFADIYSQTIAYGMFAARLHDPTLEDFSRQEAAELIPKSNPFLRRLFQYIAGYDLDQRINWIVDALADIFRATDVKKLLKDFGKTTQQNDPIIHFYETFLSEYDPKLKKSRGVWYTPQPVVNFIVRAVDDILKTDFNLKDGLADTSKTKIKVDTQMTDNRTATNKRQAEIEVHKVQILDPATGTGTFLAEIIKHVYNTRFKTMQGVWSQYVENHLIPRLNGFEILMASYAMAHLKLDMLLTETGYKPTKEQRFRIYLTNSLEEHHPDTGTLWANVIANEANEANHIKRDTPVMVVMGNPPYSGISSNMGEWVSNLIEDYKYVDGEHFGERKHWLHDDYVKFLRYGQHYIDKNGEGILAFINNHSFLDNPTFRGMRWNLLKSFDKIYILDLHGNSLKKEVCPDGSPDKNVFDIKQGVSINIFVKSGKKKSNELGKVYHADYYGKREVKYKALWENTLDSVKFKKIIYSKPYYFFVPKNEIGIIKYNKGFKIDEVFKSNTVGFVTANDRLNVSFSKEELAVKIKDLLELEETIWRIKYKRKKDSRDWTYLTAKNDAISNFEETNFKEFSYRPFDKRITLYTGKSRGLYSSPQPKIMQHFLKGNNVGLSLCKQFKTGNQYVHVFISNKMIESSYVSNRTSEITSIFPLYLYPETNGQQTIDGQSERTPNLNKDIVNEIAEKLSLTFTPEKEENKGTFAPIDILDYIYAVLHSPTYREKYKEFLKIDFPRVPYPEDRKTFWKLVKLGGELRQIHLLESSKTDQFITTYPIDGNNTVDKPKYENGKVWINDTQYFDNVPLIAWEFYIGGYQPAQKWLKDRKGRDLSFEDILHYQKIIVALTETDKLMKQIDIIEIE